MLWIEFWAQKVMKVLTPHDLRMWHYLEKGLYKGNAVWLVPFLIKRGNVDTEKDRHAHRVYAMWKWRQRSDQDEESKTRGHQRWPANQQRLGDPSQPSERKETPDNICISSFSPGCKTCLLFKRLCLWYFVTAQAFGIRQVKPRRYVDMHSSLQFWKIIILHFTRPPSYFHFLRDYLVCWQHGGRGESYFRLTSVPFGMAEMNMVSSVPWSSIPTDHCLFISLF